MRMPSETARFLGSLTAPRCAARPPALGSRPDSDDLPSPPPAASIRQNIPFPAAPPAHPGVCQHWHDITDQSPIRPSSTTAATTPLSSPARSSRRSSQNHPPLQPRRRQIPIDGRVLTAFLRVPSSEAFERRPLNPRRSLTLGRHPKPYPIAAVPCYAIGAAGSNKSPSLAAALGRNDRKLKQQPTRRAPHRPNLWRPFPRKG